MEFRFQEVFGGRTREIIGLVITRHDHYSTLIIFNLVTKKHTSNISYLQQCWEQEQNVQTKTKIMIGATKQDQDLGPIPRPEYVRQYDPKDQTLPHVCGDSR